MYRNIARILFVLFLAASCSPSTPAAEEPAEAPAAEKVLVAATQKPALEGLSPTTVPAATDAPLLLPNQFGILWSGPDPTGYADTEDRLFVSSHKNGVQAFDLRSGRIIWQIDTPWIVIGADGQNAYVYTFDNQVLALDALTGSQKWAASGGEYEFSSYMFIPPSSGGYVWVSAKPGVWFALDARTGEAKTVSKLADSDSHRWFKDVIVETSHSKAAGWSARTGEVVWEAPAYMGAFCGNIYLSWNPELTALDAATGETLWQRAIEGGPFEPKCSWADDYYRRYGRLPDQPIAYLFRSDLQIQVLNLLTGETLWEGLPQAIVPQEDNFENTFYTGEIDHGLIITRPEKKITQVIGGEGYELLWENTNLAASTEYITYPLSSEYVLLPAVGEEEGEYQLLLMDSRTGQMIRMLPSKWFEDGYFPFIYQDTIVYYMDGTLYQADFNTGEVLGTIEGLAEPQIDYRPDDILIVETPDNLVIIKMQTAP